MVIIHDVHFLIFLSDDGYDGAGEAAGTSLLACALVAPAVVSTAVFASPSWAVAAGCAA